MIILTSLFILTALMLIWVVWGRAWLKSQSWGWSIRLFAAIEPIEIALWSKSETILWARFVQALTVLSGVLTWLGALDVTPLLLVLPEKYHAWVSVVPFAAVALLGLVTEILRRQTTKPLDIVAVPDDAPIELVAAIAEAEVAKDNAVAEIKAEKQAGAL